MNTFILFLVQLCFKLLPDTRAFGFKRWALRMAGAKIDKNVRICSSVRILGNASLTIGENTWIGHGTWILCSAPICIGKNVNIAPFCYIGTGTHIIDPTGESVAGEGISKSIEIQDGAWVCVRSTILPGVTIGKRSILAAGSVANRSIDNHTIYGGIPVKKIKDIYENI